MRVSVVVVGDVGRSPRVCYHALSFAQHGCSVDLIGYVNTPVDSTVASHSAIRVVSIRPPPDWFSLLLPSALSLGSRFLWVFVMLLFALLFRNGLPSLVLVQNPPGLPALLVCWICAKIKRCRLVVDWHNLTSTVLKEQLEKNSCTRGAGVDSKSDAAWKIWVVSAAKRWERLFGRKADLNICVTHSMRDHLSAADGIRAITLYDRPPSWRFVRLSTEDKHRFFYKLAADKLYSQFWSTDAAGTAVPPQSDGNREETRFSERIIRREAPEKEENKRKCQLRQDRAALLVSSTSWTVDEDFGILLNAVRLYDSTSAALSQENADNRMYLTMSELSVFPFRLPPLVVVITGKGPLKNYYMEQIAKLSLKRVEFLTPWLEHDDYPRMLASADLGLSFHSSTSGLDLPMKVVDMFGCHLPVLALEFACVSELVRGGENGHTFKNGAELCERLVSLLRGFPGASQELNQLKRNLQKEPLVSWEDNWSSTLWPLVQTGRQTRSP